jgi:hypothetical protein
LRIYIFENSIHLKNDLLFGKEASDGTKFKEKYKTENGVVAEKYHHFCFVGSTLITTKDGQKRIDEIHPGDLVLTRVGYRNVKRVYNNGIKEVKTYSIGDTKITCTPNHKFWTKEFSFISISLLTDWITFCIFDKNTNTWKEKLLFTTESHLQDTQTQNEEATGFIIQEAEEKMGRRLIVDCISIFGLKRMAKYLKDAVFTIKTKTRLITRWTISNVNQEISTSPNTCFLLKERECQSKLLLSLQGQKRLNGINQKKEGNGTLKCLYLKLKLLLLFVKSAVSQPKENTKELCRCSAETSVVSDQQQERLERKETVYDIEVDGQHEYFANGILAHNSDGLDYLICAAYPVEFEKYQTGGSGVENWNLGRSYVKNKM